MIEVTVKTLDGQNRSFSVPDTMTVRQFKEKISSSINIDPETQRLIFQGRVLQDDKLLKDYDVAGKVIHVVMRPPPSSGRPATSDAPSTNNSDVSSIVVGSLTLPSDILDANMVQNIAQDAIRSMGDLGRSARVSTRTNADGSAVDVHIHLGPVQTGQVMSEAQMRLNTATQMINLANEALSQLENPDAANSFGSSASGIPGLNLGTPISQPTGAESSTAAPDVAQASSPMDTSNNQEPSTSEASDSESQTENQSSQNSNTTSPSTNQNPEVSSTSQSTSSSQGTGTQQPRGPQRPNISALGDVLAQVSELNQRLQPHLERFTNIVRADAQMDQNEQREAQLVCNMVSEVMHSVSHCYHSLSDLMVDLSQATPRQLYVTLAITHPHTVVQQSIPLQAQLHVGGSPRLIRRQFNAASNTRPSQSTAVPSTSASTPASSVSTGTSTGPQPTTTETGTQPTATASTTTDTGTQFVQAQSNVHVVEVGDDLSEEDVNRISQEMTAGLQSVIGQGIRQGDGTPENPYVYLEMGPDSVTVNSISAQVVTTAEPSNLTSASATNTTQTSQTAGSQTSAGTQASTGAATQPTSAAGTQPTATPSAGAQQQIPNFVQGLVQQILQQTGVQGTPQRMQINIGHPGGPMGMRAGIPIRMMGQHMFRGTTPQSESGTQTTNRAGQPANSGTQTPATQTSTFGTQTRTSGNRPTASNTSGTQTGPRPAAFVIPGLQGMGGPMGMNPVDPYLQCASRHFLTRHARNMINGSTTQNSDTALADMVSNLMSGLLGVTQPASSSTTTTTTASSGSPASSTGTGSETLGSAPPPVSTPQGGQPQARPTIHMAGPGGFAGIFRPRMPVIPGMRVRFGPPQPPTSGARPPTFGPVPPQSSATPTSGGSAPGSQGQTGAEPNFIQMLRQMLQSANNRPGTQPTTGSQTPRTDSNQNETGTGADQQPISDEAFTQLVSGITNFMSQAALGQAPRQTIGDFLRNLGDNYNIPQGEGFLNDIFSCVLTRLQITDLIQVFYGMATPLNQVQGALKEYLNQRVLEGAAPTPDNIRAGVEQLVQSMEAEIDDTVSASTPKPHIDFRATLTRFFTQHLNNVVTLIMNSRDGDVMFGQDLYACVRRLLGELFVLCSRCLGGMNHVETLVSRRLRSLTSGVNPFIEEWMGTMTARQLSQFIPTIAVTEGEISYFVVFKDSASSRSGASSKKPKLPPKPTGLGSSSGAKRDTSPLRAPSPKRVTKGTEGRTEQKSMERQPMELSSPTSSPGASEVDMENHKRSPTVKGAASPGVKKTPVVMSPGREPSPSGAQPASGATGGDWQSVVPSEWVPVIERDIQTQQSQRPQPPHSDIYLQGMPPKRRKLMTQDRSSDLSNSSEALPESLRRAVAAAAVEPISSLENLSSELTSDPELQTAFDSHIASNVTQRIDSDTDYKSDRFPNTEDYYHKSSYRKK